MGVRFCLCAPPRPCAAHLRGGNPSASHRGSLCDGTALGGRGHPLFFFFFALCVGLPVRGRKKKKAAAVGVFQKERAARVGIRASVWALCVGFWRGYPLWRPRKTPGFRFSASANARTTPNSTSYVHCECSTNLVDADADERAPRPTSSYFL